MPGLAPKLASDRARRNTPTLGEWRELAALGAPCLPDLTGKWTKTTIALWSGLQADPVTQLFGPSEIAQCVFMARIYQRAMSKTGTAAHMSEFRQWMDRLGFTPKGKRDLRLRVSERSDAPVLRIV